MLNDFGPALRGLRSRLDYSFIVSNVEDQDRAGLCVRCRFMRLMNSDRGATFYSCERSATDVAFPKYPRLPVLQCPGYERRPAKNDSPNK
ncbi:hypothetical protein SBA1_820063 [Candidatus Sulfotelmatobacter kueseliae]|uniref:Uncharacterized protein n=1 Tax=Candidatus Sulfotelmatobacter kueseliae TaxID=2042962 RepID=A0A2U3L8L5_9BACT|nr:hypothetical protein SBA1_820063 [Candidatus Sulfotelmatobacter kueseliae]